jgi:hypothetical protein
MTFVDFAVFQQLESGNRQQLLQERAASGVPI